MTANSKQTLKLNEDCRVGRVRAWTKIEGAFETLGKGTSFVIFVTRPLFRSFYGLTITPRVCSSILYASRREMTSISLKVLCVNRACGWQLLKFSILLRLITEELNHQGESLVLPELDSRRQDWRGKLKNLFCKCFMSWEIHQITRKEIWSEGWPASSSYPGRAN